MGKERWLENDLPLELQETGAIKKVRGGATTTKKHDGTQKWKENMSGSTGATFEDGELFFFF